LQNKSDWSKHKKPANITVTSKITFLGYPRSKFVFFVFHTKRTCQIRTRQIKMDPICRRWYFVWYICIWG